MKTFYVEIDLPERYNIAKINEEADAAALGLSKDCRMARWTENQAYYSLDTTIKNRNEPRSVGLFSSRVLIPTILILLRICIVVVPDQIPAEPIGRLGAKSPHVLDIDTQG
jgi:hypothetical protein